MQRTTLALALGRLRQPSQQPLQLLWKPMPAKVQRAAAAAAAQKAIREQGSKLPKSSEAHTALVWRHQPLMMLPNSSCKWRARPQSQAPQAARQPSRSLPFSGCCMPAPACALGPSASAASAPSQSQPLPIISSNHCSNHSSSSSSHHHATALPSVPASA